MRSCASATALSPPQRHQRGQEEKAIRASGREVDRFRAFLSPAAVAVILGPHIRPPRHQPGDHRRIVRLGRGDMQDGAPHRVWRVQHILELIALRCRPQQHVEDSRLGGIAHRMEKRLIFGSVRGQQLGAFAKAVGHIVGRGRLEEVGRVEHPTVRARLGGGRRRRQQGKCRQEEQSDLTHRCWQTVFLTRLASVSRLQVGEEINNAHAFSSCRA